MELFFNELSVLDKEKLEYADISEIGKIYKELDKYGIKSCRIDDESYGKILSLIRRMPNNANAMGFYFAFFHRPFENKEVLEREEEYYSYRWEADGHECYGLALSYIMDSIALSLQDKKWKEPFVRLQKGEEIVRTKHIGIASHIAVHEEWICDRKEVELVQCKEIAGKKSIKLRDDHGKSELWDFSKRIVENVYVCEVVNSLPFHPHQRRFIYDVKENGMIEIVLPWTDKGLGIAVKTTGRNFRETKAIAKILEKKYGYMK